MSNKKILFLLAGAALIVASIIVTLTLHWADFHVYYTAGHSLLSGRTDLYAPDFGDSQIMDYRYPLFFLIVFLPFCWLPYQAAEFVWLWLNIAVIYLTIVAIRRGVKIIGLKLTHERLIFLLSFLICAKYIVVSFRILNVHIIVLCMVFAAFYLLLRQKQLAAAFLIALTITFKLFPVIALPYFAIKKQWHFLAMTVVFVATFNLLPAIYFGFDQNFLMLHDWYQHVMVNNDFHNTNGPLNVSLEGQLQRYLTRVDYSRRFEDPWYQNINLFVLPESIVGAISKALTVLIASATFFVIWYFGEVRKRNTSLKADTANFNDFENHRTAKSSAFDSLAYHEFGLITCLTLIIEPRTNVYYFLALFFPLIPFLNSLFQNRSRFNAFAFGLILIITCGLPLLPGSGLQRLFLVLGVDFYAVLILWFVLGVNMIRESIGLKRESGRLSFTRV